MWDFARWGRQDTSDSKSTALPLSEERVQWWMDRMSQTIEHARARWPEAKIWIRTVHRVGTETVEGKASCKTDESCVMCGPLLKDTSLAR